MSDYTIPLKTCPGCGESKPATTEYFHRDKTRPDGLYSCCKACKSKRMRERYAADPERARKRSKKWRDANPEKVREDKRKRYQFAIEQDPDYNRKYYAANAERMRSYSQQYYATHKESKQEYNRKWRASIVIACPACNMAKHDKLPHEWPEGGRLL